MLPFNTASRRVACGQTPVTLVSSLRSSARDARTSGHVCANACTFQFRSRCMNYPIDPYVSARYTLCVRNLRIQAHPGVSDVSVRTPTSVRPSLCGSSLSSGSSLHRRTYGTRTNRKDHYEILGVERSASISEIKQAYYTLAKKHHPDRQKKQKGNQEAFNLISEAYQILSNEKLRQSYDEGNGPAPNDLSFDAEQMLREFEKAFNKEGKIESNRRPVTIPIQLNFLAAVKGCEVDVSYRLKEKCVPCKGSGATAGSPAHVVCSKCGGGGLVMMPAFFILEAHEIDCPKCSGEGVIVPEPCRSCFGRGAEHSTVNKKVQIPPGVVNGQEILLEKSGQAVVMLHVDESSKTFKRKGMDIFSTIEVCALRAALGDVPCNMETVHGTHSVVLPSGTQHGDEVRLAGKGIQSLEADIPPGAHVGVVRIVVPRLLTSSQSERLKKFDAT